ncbi:transposase [Evansella sp. AB-P1]|uniref:transposase n=1 Tax=Evansella sp. AB-P1 TaxID=3037653 RepID=UPI00241FE554|nr:transposase [Evansella sp. AB-P1]MDG5789893.1 transposase [Evansella sp. AB-P1]
MVESWTDHDRLFKELISTFFEEFMVLFFPEVHEQLDFTNTHFLSQEIFTDVTDGDKHEVDLLVETKLRGMDSLIIVHVESQASFQKQFNERMFIYFSRIFQKYRRKILPIAIFSYDTPKDEPNALAINFPFVQVLNFNYLSIELKKKNWRDYIRSENPVAAALLSKMGYNKDERIEVKKEFFRIIIRLELDRARESLLTGFFETYLKLTDDEEYQFQEEVKAMDPKEAKKIMEVITSYERKGIEIGVEQGIEQGIEKGIEQGIEKGIEQGIEKGLGQVAKRMLSKGKKVDEIIDLTGLSISDVERLRAEMDIEID